MKITVLHSKDALDPPVDPILDQLDAALAANGHTSRRLAVDDAVQPLIDELTSEQPDLVFNLAESFRGKSRIERHRMINQTLSGELAGGVHALAIHANAPGE